MIVKKFTKSTKNNKIIKIKEIAEDENLGIRYSFWVEPDSHDSFVFQVDNNKFPKQKINTDFILAQIINELNPFTSLREMYDHLNAKQKIKIGERNFYIECIGLRPFE